MVEKDSRLYKHTLTQTQKQCAQVMTIWPHPFWPIRQMDGVPEEM